MNSLIIAQVPTLLNKENISHNSTLHVQITIMLITVTLFGNLYEEKKYHSCTWRSVHPPVCHPAHPTGSLSHFCPKNSICSRMPRQSGTGLKFVSCNCNGLNQPIKCSKVLHHLQQLGASIVFLQDTHLKSSSHFRLTWRWVSQVFHSSFNGKSMGGAILIHKSVPFVCSNVIAGPNGRFVFVTGQLYSNSVILANVYGSNWDDNKFFPPIVHQVTRHVRTSTHYGV